MLTAVAAEGKQDAPPAAVAAATEPVGSANVAAAMFEKFFFLFMLVTKWPYIAGFGFIMDICRVYRWH